MALERDGARRRPSDVFGWSPQNGWRDDVGGPGGSSTVPSPGDRTSSSKVVTRKEFTGQRVRPPIQKHWPPASQTFLRTAHSEIVLRPLRTASLCDRNGWWRSSHWEQESRVRSLAVVASLAPCLALKEEAKRGTRKQSTATGARRVASLAPCLVPGCRESSSVALAKWKISRLSMSGQ